MGKIHKRSGKKNESVAGISRRDFIKYSGAAGGALLLGIHGELAMSSQKSRVTFASTENRKTGVASSLEALNLNPVKNKDVLIKPNFNTAAPQIVLPDQPITTRWWLWCKRSGRWGPNPSAWVNEAIRRPVKLWSKKASLRL
jgi:hypothetical protein